MRKKNSFLRLLGIVLVLVILFQLSPIQAVAMGNSPAFLEVSVEKGSEVVPMIAMKQNGTWYVDVNALAELADCQVSVNSSNSTLSVFRPSPVLILYSISSSACLEENGTIFVPFEDCAKSLGLRFQRFVQRDGVYVTAMRTPTDLLQVLNTIFARKNYHLWDTPAELGWVWLVGEEAARLWAFLPWTGSMVGTVTGKDEQERYDRAMASILSSSGDFLDMIYDWAEMDRLFKDAGKKLSMADDVIDKVWEWIDNNDQLNRQLNDAGIYETVREMFRTGSNPYEEGLPEFIQGYPTVANAINIDYWLDTFAFYGAAVDGEEALLLAMKKVLGSSSNAQIRRSAEKLFDSQFGSGAVTLSDIYLGYVFNFIMDQCSDSLEDAIYGSYSLLGKGFALLITGMWESLFDSPSINGISDAIIYYSIYNNIAMELSDYYYLHRYDSTDHIGMDLRAVAILYLNTVKACVEKCRFDSNMADVADQMDALIEADLMALLDFSEQEYDPSFSNAEIISYFDSLPTSDSFPDLQQSPPSDDSPSSVPSAPTPDQTPAFPAPDPGPGESWSGWSEWSDTPVTPSDTCQVETRTAYHYYYFVCSNCGAHIHGYGPCYSWAGGCGQHTVPEGSYSTVRLPVPYSEAKDFHGTGVYYVNSDSYGLVFAYIDPSSPYYISPITQYRYSVLLSAPSDDSGSPGSSLPAGCFSISDGAYYGQLWSIRDCPGGWAAEIALQDWDLYEDSYIHSLRVGDTVNICWMDYQVTGISNDVIYTDGSFYLSRSSADPLHPCSPPGYWVACTPSGHVATYGLGTGTFFIRNNATFLANATLEGQQVSNPFDLISLYPYDPTQGIEVYLEASGDGIDYLESVYTP